MARGIRGLLLGALLLSGTVPAALGQTLSASVNPVVITPPTEAQYDAASPANVTSATTMTLTLTCPNGGGSGGCGIDWSYSGSALLVDYQVTGASGCNSGFTTSSFASVPSATTALVTMNKNGTCTLTVLFRVRGLSYTAQQAGATILQGLTLVGKRL